MLEKCSRQFFDEQHTCFVLIHSASSWLRPPTAPSVCSCGGNKGKRTCPTLLYGIGTPSSRARVGTRSVCGTTSGSFWEIHGGGNVSHYIILCSHDLNCALTLIIICDILK